MNNLRTKKLSVWTRLVPCLTAFLLAVSVAGLAWLPRASAELASSGTVRVPGTFNHLISGCPDWAYDNNTPCANYLTPQGDGTYAGSITLPPGEYAFKIFDNGTWVGASTNPDAGLLGTGADYVPADPTNDAVNSYFSVTSSSGPVRFTYDPNTRQYSVSSASDPIYTVAGSFQKDLPITDTISSQYLSCLDEADAAADAAAKAINPNSVGEVDTTTNDWQIWRPACMNIQLTPASSGKYVWGSTAISQMDGHSFKVVEGLSFYNNWGVATPHREDGNWVSTHRGHDIFFDQNLVTTTSQYDSNPTSQKQYTEVLFGPTNDQLCAQTVGLNYPKNPRDCAGRTNTYWRPLDYDTVVNGFSAYDNGNTKWDNLGKVNQRLADGLQTYTLTFTAQQLADTSRQAGSQPITWITADNINDYVVLTDAAGNPVSSTLSAENLVAVSDWSGADGVFTATVKSKTPGRYDFNISVKNTESSAAPVLIYQPSLMFVGALMVENTTDPTHDYQLANGVDADWVNIKVTDQNGDVAANSTVTLGFDPAAPANVVVKLRGGGDIPVVNNKLTVTTDENGEVALEVRSGSNSVNPPDFTLVVAPITVPGTKYTDALYPTLIADDTVVHFIPLDPKLSINKTAGFAGDSPTGDVGGSLTYKITVTNTGNTPVSGVTVTDPKFATATSLHYDWPGTDNDGTEVTSGTLGITKGVDDVVTVTATYPIAQGDVVAHQAVNTARACYTGPESQMVPAPESKCVDTPEVRTPLPQLTITASPKDGKLVWTGDAADLTDEDRTAKFTFVIRNTGALPVTNISIDKELLVSNPDDWAFDDTCFYNGDETNTVAFGAGQLPSSTNDYLTCTATYLVADADLVRAVADANHAAGGSFAATGSFAAKRVDGTTAPGTTKSAPDTAAYDVSWLEIVKSGQLAPSDDTYAVVGDTVTWTLTVTNLGTTTQTGLAIADQTLAARGLTLPTACAQATLAPQADYSCTVTDTVKAGDLLAGKIVNTAEVTSDDNEDPSNEVTVPLTERPPYTVTYLGNGNTAGTVPDPAQHLKDSTVTVAGPGDLAKQVGDQEYRFTGWVSSITGQPVQGGETFTMPGEDVTLTAQWVPLYTVTYDPNGGTDAPTDPGKYAEGDTVTVGGEPSRPGYVFVGWEPDAPPNTALDPGDTFDMPDGNVVLTAQWAGLEVTKEADKTRMSAAGTVTYTITVTNIGTVALDVTEVIDGMEGLSELVCELPATLAAAGPDSDADTLVCTATREVSAEEVAAGGSLKNTATANGTVVGGGTPVTDDSDEVVVELVPPGQSSTPPGPTTSGPPQTSTAPPQTSTAPPQTTTTPPRTSTPPPGPTTTAPPQTSSAPPQTTTTPPRTSTPPPQTTTVPPQTSSAPPPQTTTVPPQTSSAPPPQTTTAPPQTSSAPPPQTTTVPPQTSSAPPAPPQTTTAPPPATSTPPGPPQTSTPPPTDQPVTLTYDPNGGDPMDPSDSPVSLAKGGTVDSTPTPNRDGYAFQGWTTRPGGAADEGNETFDTDYVVNEDMTVYAQWLPIPGKLQVVKSANPMQITQPGTITYTFVVTNVGAYTVSQVAVADPMEGLSALSCTGPTTLRPDSAGVHDELVCTATRVVTAAEIAAATQPLHNVAVVTGTTDVNKEPIEEPSNPVDVPLSPQMPYLSLSKVANKQAVDSLETVTYTFVVTNGPVAVDNVAITDLMGGLSAVSCPATSMAAGETMTCTATYRVTQADLEAGQPLVNQATVTGTPPGGPPVTSQPTPPVTVGVVQKVLLDVVKSVNLDEATVGDELIYSVRVTNRGNVNVKYEISDVFSGKGNWSKKLVGCVDAANGTTLATAVLAPGQVMVCTFEPYTVVEADLAADSLVNVVTVTGVPVEVPTPTPTPFPSTVTTPLIPIVQVPSGGTVMAGVDGPGTPLGLLGLIAAGAGLAGLRLMRRIRH